MIRAVAVLTLALVAAPSQPPPPTPPESGHTHQNQTAPEKSKAEYDQQTANQTPTRIDKTLPVAAHGEQQQQGAPHQNSAPAERRPQITDVLVAGFTGVLALLAVLQWRAAHKQARYMRDALIATDKAADAALISAETTRLMERPWITAAVEFADPVTVPEPIIFYTGGNVRVAPMVVLKNIGHSAATDVHYVVELFAMSRFSDDIPQERTKSIVTAAVTMKEPGFAIFPGEEVRRLHIHEIGEVAIGDCSDGDNVVLCMLIAVAYKFATSNAVHVTRAAYYVGKDAPGNLTTMVRIGEALARRHIKVTKDYPASYAD